MLHGLLLPCLCPGRRCCARKISAAVETWQEAGGCPLHRRAALSLLCQLWADDALPLQLQECWEASGGSCSQLLGSVEQPCTKENSYVRSELHLHSANGCLNKLELAFILSTHKYELVPHFTKV